MYDKVLDTFKAVADTGSFLQAAEKCYITHTAVIKQMNQLENRLGVRLFARSNQGVSLTAAGQSLYTDTIKIMRFSDEAHRRLQEAHCSSLLTIRVGTSALYPCKAFLELWDKIGSNLPRFQLRIVPFDDSQNFVKVWPDEYDFIVGPYDTRQRNACHFLPVGYYRFCIAMPRKHILAQKQSVTFSDLSGEKLMMMWPGRSALNDAVRQIILSNFPDIEVLDIEPHYSTDTFNQCALTNSMLLSLECWKDVHPLLSTVPLQGGYKLPYGIVTSNTPSEEMKEFWRVIKTVISPPCPL